MLLHTPIEYTTHTETADTADSRHSREQTQRIFLLFFHTASREREQTTFSYRSVASRGSGRAVAVIVGIRVV